MVSSSRLFATAAGVLLITSISAADFLLPTAWSRNDPFTTYQQYERFASLGGPNQPNSPPNVPAAPFNPNGDSDVVGTAVGAFITSGGNIYAPSNTLAISVTIPEYALGAGYVTTVIFQTRTLGTELNYSGVRLEYNDGLPQSIAAVANSELSRTPAGGFGGNAVEHAFRFELPYSPGVFTIQATAAEPNLSLDRVLVDTIVTRQSAATTLQSGQNATIGFVPFAVPEPLTITLLGLSTLLMVRRR